MGKYLYNEFIAEEYENETALQNDDMIQKWDACRLMLKPGVDRPTFLHYMFIVQCG